MKLDRIKFAALVAYIVGLRPEYDVDFHQLDTLTEINVEPVEMPVRPIGKSR